MTNIIKWTEGKPFIYSSEKPFPRKEDYETGTKYDIDELKKDIDLWFSQATKTPVKQGEEKKFDNYLWTQYNDLNEGVEIDRSCFTITKDYNICDGCESEVCQIDPQCYDLVAVFVPPVVDKLSKDEEAGNIPANEKTTGINLDVKEVKELINDFTNLGQLLYGISPDAKTEGWWSEWDEEQVNNIGKWLKKLYALLPTKNEIQ